MANSRPSFWALAAAAGLAGVGKVLHCDAPMFERPVAEPMAALVVPLTVLVASWAGFAIARLRGRERAAAALIERQGGGALIVTSAERAAASDNFGRPRVVISGGNNPAIP